MTVAEALKAAGMTDAEISAIDAKATGAFTTILGNAETQQQQALADRERAELTQRATNQMFEQEITPALNAWGQREANLTAERDYWRTMAEKAKTGGFMMDQPPFALSTPPPPPGQPRNMNGQFVANTNPVPGSPNVQDLEKKLGTAFGLYADMQWKYRSLYGKEMPDSPTALLNEAETQHMPVLDWVAKKYDYVKREGEIKAEEQKKHDDAIRAEVTAAKDKEFAEKFGSNPNVRQAQVSRYSDISKAVTEGKRQDPLKMSPEQRKEATRRAIRDEMESSSQTVQ
jgi:hypothetical protein